MGAKISVAIPSSLLRFSPFQIDFSLRRSGLKNYVSRKAACRAIALATAG
jgi:hypothetical protein